ncbi:hypothetical protein HETIRDRAFT_167838 [Heterobasidion irregulare TC 32-1]|uniref:Uncharacterized protein n=1 Tax=Heterobasidion irregulare (strain TC 32-1) TaxID=747525 RepID=W4KJS0_HETIT|nr:uncharacterized protein HETIRDRAFT_167838 [Heterobasidion irregulare TC 32-1]ETW85949.1 hypothetical protein HETIRDRAFT_167838 [Heterobasidion irregulare TC 32-1]
MQEQSLCGKLSALIFSPDFAILISSYIRMPSICMCPAPLPRVNHAWPISVKAL